MATFSPLLAALAGLFLILLIAWEGFETIILPRSVTRQLRITRLFYKLSWPISAALAKRLPSHGSALSLSYFGPLSLPLLLIFWAFGLILGFALLQWSVPHGFERVPGMNRFQTDLYQSGVTFFTLGYGDVTPRSNLTRFIAVSEAGVGFGFLAIVIGYLPVLYQAFSQREAIISLLDARASSPPSSVEMLRRYGEGGQMEQIVSLLAGWEVWASQILESHLSYPVLTYYRSQHDGQSWLGAITAIMDTCALLLVGCSGEPQWQRSVQWQARMTLAMCRHAAIDLCYVFNLAPVPFDSDRLAPSALSEARRILAGAGLPLCDGPEDDQKLTELRGLYEPYVNALAGFLMFEIPTWLPHADTPDNWQTSAWDHDTRHF